MPLLILPPSAVDNSVRIEATARAAGWQIARLSGYRVPAGLAGSEDIVIYGEPQFALTVAEQLGVRLFAPTPDWLARLPERFRRRRVRLTTMAEARTLTEPAFVRSAVNKSFPSAVVASGAELPSGERVHDQTLVMIAEPVAWKVEYRCFVLNRRVATSSIYLREGRLARDEAGAWPAPEAERAAALAFAESVLTADDVAIPPAVVLDVGVIADRGWAVVETNAAWSSGLYGCEQSAILPVLQRACVKPSRADADDAEWVAEP